jgi:hypothetical protein
MIRHAIIFACLAGCGAAHEGSDLGASDGQHRDGPRRDSPAAADGATWIDTCFAGLQPTGKFFVAVMDFVTEDGSTSLRLAREPGDPGGRPVIGETYPYHLVRFAIVRASGEKACVTDLAAMTYDFQHHNWNDTANARSGSTVYSVKMRYEPVLGGWTDSLTGLEDGTGKTLWGPLRLKNTHCTSIPLDLNACLMRTGS